MRQTDRQTDRQAGRQVDIQAGMQTGRETCRQADRQRDRQADRQKQRQTDRQTDRQAGRQAQTDRQRERQTVRQTGRQTGRHADRQLLDVNKSLWTPRLSVWPAVFEASRLALQRRGPCQSVETSVALHLVDKLDTRLSHVGVSSLLVSRDTLKQRDSCHQGMYPLPAHLIFFVSVSLCPVSVYPSLSVVLSVCLSLSLSVSVSVCLSVSVSISVCLSASVSVSLCLSLSLSISVSLPHPPPPPPLSLSLLFSRFIDDLPLHVKKISVNCNMLVDDIDITLQTIFCKSEAICKTA